jgi:hypothetical protein
VVSRKDALMFFDEINMRTAKNTESLAFRQGELLAKSPHYLEFFSASWKTG